MQKGTAYYQKKRLTKQIGEYSSCKWEREFRDNWKNIFLQKSGLAILLRVLVILWIAAIYTTLFWCQPKILVAHLKQTTSCRQSGMDLRDSSEVRAAGADHGNSKKQKLHQQSQSKPFPFVSPLSLAVGIICVFRGKISLSLSWSALGLSAVCSYLLCHSTPAPRPLFSPLPSCSLSLWGRGKLKFKLSVISVF